MNAVSYSRKVQFSDEIEKHIGVLDVKESAKYTYFNIYHPIIKGILMRGTCHTNAFDVVDIVIDTVVIDGATSKPVTEI